MSVKDLELNNQLNIENTDVAKLNNNEKLLMIFNFSF